MIGESAAGHGFSGSLGARRDGADFTGAPVPQGADAILIQEERARRGGSVDAFAAIAAGRHIRAAGLDFDAGEALLRPARGSARSTIALAAAMNHAELPVARRPSVAILATGDELVLPGAASAPTRSSLRIGFAIRRWSNRLAASLSIWASRAMISRALEGGVRAAIASASATCW